MTDTTNTDPGGYGRRSYDHSERITKIEEWRISVDSELDRINDRFTPAVIELHGRGLASLEERMLYMNQRMIKVETGQEEHSRLMQVLTIAVEKVSWKVGLIIGAALLAGDLVLHDLIPYFLHPH